MDRIFSCQSPPLMRLQNFFELLYSDQKAKAEKYGHVCGCPFSSVGSELAGVDQRIRGLCDQMMGVATKYRESAISDAMREGSVTVTDAAASARHLNSLILGVLLEARVKNSLDEVAQLTNQVFQFLGAKMMAA